MRINATSHLGGRVYSSSNTVSFISGKSSSSETGISSPDASLWSVFNFGFFVLPDIRFSTMLWALLPGAALAADMTAVEVIPPKYFEVKYFRKDMDAIRFEYNGGGYTDYKLRDLGEVLGFNVGWNRVNENIYIETDRPYDPNN